MRVPHAVRSRAPRTQPAGGAALLQGLLGKRFIGGRGGVPRPPTSSWLQTGRLARLSKGQARTSGKRGVSVGRRRGAAAGGAPHRPRCSQFRAPSPGPGAGGRPGASSGLGGGAFPALRPPRSDGPRGAAPAPQGPGVPGPAPMPSPPAGASWVTPGPVRGEGRPGFLPHLTFAICPRPPPGSRLSAPRGRRPVLPRADASPGRLFWAPTGGCRSSAFRVNTSPGLVTSV